MEFSTSGQAGMPLMTFPVLPELAPLNHDSTQQLLSGSSNLTVSQSCFSRSLDSLPLSSMSCFQLQTNNASTDSSSVATLQLKLPATMTLSDIGLPLSDAANLAGHWQLSPSLTTITLQPMCNSELIGQSGQPVQPQLGHFLPSQNVGTLILSPSGSLQIPLESFAAVKAATSTDSDCKPTSMLPSMATYSIRKLANSSLLFANDSNTNSSSTCAAPAPVTMINVKQETLETLPRGNVKWPHKFFCDVCGQGCRDRHTLKKHSYIHTGERPYECATCGKTFRVSSILRSHERTHLVKEARPRNNSGSNKPPQYYRFFCSVCGQGARDRYSLRKHERIHTGERPYPCRQCDKMFRDTSTRSAHEKTHLPKNVHHNNGSAMLCTSAALVHDSFTTTTTTATTMTTNNTCDPLSIADVMSSAASELQPTKLKAGAEGYYRYFCSVCGQGSRDRYAYNKHFRRHTGEKPYHCNYCDKHFRDSSSRSAHQRSHPEHHVTSVTNSVTSSSLSCTTSTQHLPSTAATSQSLRNVQVSTNSSSQTSLPTLSLNLMGNGTSTSTVQCMMHPSNSSVGTMPMITTLPINTATALNNGASIFHISANGELLMGNGVSGNSTIPTHFINNNGSSLGVMLTPINSIDFVNGQSLSFMMTTSSLSGTLLTVDEHDKQQTLTIVEDLPANISIIPIDHQQEQLQLQCQQQQLQHEQSLDDFQELQYKESLEELLYKQSSHKLHCEQSVEDYGQSLVKQQLECSMVELQHQQSQNDVQQEQSTVELHCEQSMKDYGHLLVKQQLECAMVELQRQQAQNNLQSMEVLHFEYEPSLENQQEKIIVEIQREHSPNNLQMEQSLDDLQYKQSLEEYEKKDQEHLMVQIQCEQSQNNLYIQQSLEHRNDSGNKLQSEELRHEEDSLIDLHFERSMDKHSQPSLVNLQCLQSHYEINTKNLYETQHELTPTKFKKLLHEIQVGNVSDQIRVENITDEIRVENVTDEIQMENVTDETQVEKVTGEIQVKNVTIEIRMENITNEIQVEKVTDEIQVVIITDEMPVEKVTDENVSLNKCDRGSFTSKFKLSDNQLQKSNLQTTSRNSRLEILRRRFSNLVCPDCHYMQRNLRTLAAHRSNSHPLGSEFYRCTFCERCFGRSSLQHLHERLQHRAVRELLCNHCKARFLHRGQLRRHQTREHSTTLMLDSYVKNASRRTLCVRRCYKCHACRRTFSNLVSLRRHRYRVHPTPQHALRKVYSCSFRCCFCGLGFLSRNSLLMHEFVHRRQPC